MPSTLTKEGKSPITHRGLLLCSKLLLSPASSSAFRDHWLAADREWFSGSETWRETTALFIVLLGGIQIRFSFSFKIMSLKFF